MTASLARFKDDAPSAEPTQAARAATTGMTRHLDLDILRVVASFAVILIHASTPAFNNATTVGTSPNWWDDLGWLQADIIHSASRWCVPVFFMLSGAMLLDYRCRYSTGEFFRKRLAKVAIPFAAWTAIYLLWRAVTDIPSYHHPITGVQDVLALTVSRPAMFHLWYFYPLLGLYLVTPVLAVVAANSSKRLAAAFTVLVIANNMLLPAITRFTGVSFYSGFALATQYLDYFLLGWLLRDVVVGRRLRWLALGLFTVGLLVTAAGSWWQTAAQHRVDVTFVDYETLNVLACAVGTFLFVRSINWDILGKHPRMLRLIHTLAGASLGIYVIHILVLLHIFRLPALLPGQSSFRLTLSDAPSILAGALIVYAVSAVIVLGLRRVPVVRVIVP